MENTICLKCSVARSTALPGTPDPSGSATYCQAAKKYLRDMEWCFFMTSAHASAFLGCAPTEFENKVAPLLSVYEAPSSFPPGKVFRRADVIALGDNYKNALADLTGGG